MAKSKVQQLRDNLELSCLQVKQDLRRKADLRHHYVYSVDTEGNLKRIMSKDATDNEPHWAASDWHDIKDLRDNMEYSMLRLDHMIRDGETGEPTAKDPLLDPHLDSDGSLFYHRL